MPNPLTIEVKSSTSKANIDVTGLFNNISNLTKKISDNPVDWKKILFSTLSPAVLVGDLGRTLQLAVTATQDFQNALQTASSNAAGAFTDNTNLIGGMASQMTQQFGAPIADNAAAVAYLSKTWGDNMGVMNTILQAAAEANNSGFASMGEAVQVFSQVLQSWGITSAGAAQRAIAALVMSVQNGNMPLDQFAQTIISSKAGLSEYGISLEDAAASLSKLSTQSGITGAQAADIFTNFSNVIQNKTNPQVAALISAAGGILPALQAGKVEDALSSMESYFQKGGIGAAQVGIAAGLSGQAINLMSSLSEVSIGKLSQSVQTLIDKINGTHDPLQTTLLASSQLQVTWNKLIGDLSTSGWVNNLVQASNWILQLVDSLMTGDWAVQLDKLLHPSMGATESAASGTLTSLISSQLNSMAKTAGLSLSMSGINQLLGSMSIGQMGLMQNALLYPSQSNISTINNSFGINVSVTAGETPSQISTAIVKALYTQFQGLSK